MGMLTFCTDGTLNGAGARSSYDEHRGIDYGLRYELIRVAAPGTVAQAGWANAANHRASYGLHVRVDHANAFRTIYGHMSVLRVQQGDVISTDAGEFERILGISGNTGLCYGWQGTGPNNQCTDNDPPTCGAHLHFQLEHNGRVENPYGWIGAFADPWSQRPDGATSVDRWLRHPSITNSDVFPADAPLSAPPVVENESGYFTIDDGSTNFIENPTGCWTVDNTDGWAGDYRHRVVPGGNCSATWNFPQNQPSDWYHVFIHIPNDNVAVGNRNATADAARYTVHHTESPARPWDKGDEIAVIDQWAYPNDYHTSRWVYAGTYYFESNVFGTDYVRLESQTMDSRAGVMAADAVRFSPVVYRTYLPVVMKRWPPIPDTPVLNSIYNPNGSSSYTVSWNSAYLATSYTLQEATNASFSGAVTRYSGAGTSWTATGKAPGTYYYRVEAVNSYGSSGWSNVQQTTVWPTTTTFYSVADTMVCSGRPDTNYRSLSYVRAGYYSSYQVMRGLVQFDLSGIPSGTPIGQAKLWLYVHSSYDSPGTSRTIVTYRVASSWMEESVTWNTQPGYGGQYGFTSVPHAAFGWYSFDVTGLVRGWVNGSYTNYGVWILGNESPTDPNYRGFRTRESSSDPYLEIIYGEGAGASSSRTGEEILPVSPLATPEAPAMPETLRSPLPTPAP